MKTKTKILALLEIAIVLCSVFLVAIPAIAAEQTAQKTSASEITTASEDDYVLGVYGNANEDDTIDMRDLTYVKLIFFGKKPETELADAKYDGKVNPLDFIQIKLIIVGKEKEITIVDGADRIVTVKKPVNTLISMSALPVEAIRSLKAIDKVVGVNEWTLDEIFFPELIGNAQSIGGMEPDYEVIFELHPDLAFWYVGSPRYWSKYEKIQETLESAGITVFRISCKGTETYVHVEEVKKLGYILNRKEEAEEFIDFYLSWMHTINERVEGLSEEDKPTVYYESYSGPYKAYGGGDRGRKVDAAGGKNIFGDLADFVTVDPEEVIERDPEIILKMVGKISGSWFAGGYSLDKENVAVFKTEREEIMSRPELQNVEAVKEENVHIIAYSLIHSRPFVGIGYLAKWFHPDIFKDLDPQAIHQEYLTRFQGLDIDLDKQGVFAYPPLE